MRSVLIGGKADGRRIEFDLRAGEVYSAPLYSKEACPLAPVGVDDVSLVDMEVQYKDTYIMEKLIIVNDRHERIPVYYHRHTSLSVEDAILRLFRRYPQERT